MVDRQAISHTVIVSPEEAFGYMVAAEQMPDVTVEARIPESEQEAAVLVAEHVGTLIAEHGPAPAELHDFISAATHEVRGAFDDPEAGGVFVRLTTVRDGDAHRRFSTIAMLATAHQAYLPE